MEHKGVGRTQKCPGPVLSLRYEFSMEHTHTIPNNTLEAMTHVPCRCIYNVCHLDSKVVSTKERSVPCGGRRLLGCKAGYVQQQPIERTCTELGWQPTFLCLPANQVGVGGILKKHLYYKFRFMGLFQCPNEYSSSHSLLF